MWLRRRSKAKRVARSSNTLLDARPSLPSLTPSSSLQVIRTGGLANLQASMPPRKSTRASAARQASQLRQRSIADILRIESSRSSTDAFEALMKLETRAMPEEMATEELEPSYNYRTACFDMSSTTSQAWAAHTLCKRCALLNELLQGEPGAICDRLRCWVSGNASAIGLMVKFEQVMVHHTVMAPHLKLQTPVI